VVSVALLVGVVMGVAGCSSSFDLTGTWDSVGDTSWTQTYPGAQVTFSDGSADLGVYKGDYRLYREGDVSTLQIRTFSHGQVFYRVVVVDDDTIELYIPLRDEPQIILQRVG